MLALIKPRLTAKQAFGFLSSVSSIFATVTKSKAPTNVHNADYGFQAPPAAHLWPRCSRLLTALVSTLQHRQKGGTQCHCGKYNFCLVSCSVLFITCVFHLVVAVSPLRAFACVQSFRHLCRSTLSISQHAFFCYCCHSTGVHSLGLCETHSPIRP